MKASDFKDFALKNIVVLDGATGTELQAAGLPESISPELWVLENPDPFRKIQSAYVKSGSQIIYTCTFGANRFKLSEFKFGGSVRVLNMKLALLSREAADGRALVAGNIGPTGMLIEPFGQIPFEDAVEAFKEQILGLVDGGCDILIIETMMDIQEARAALIAAKEVSNLPALVSMTFSEDGRTLTGTAPEAAAITLQSLGADAVGCNCSLGPDSMIPLIREMKKVAKIPLIAKPNAGLPKLVNGMPVFDMSPAKFASFARDFADAGCNLLGGCCGTNPEFIAELSSALKGLASRKPEPIFASALSSSRKIVCIGHSLPIALIGERINPTGKKTLKEELKDGKFKEVKRFAIEQKEKGADILDVNIGAPNVDESRMLPEAVKIISMTSDLPLCLDSSNCDAIKNALRIYPGRALINSISLEDEKISNLLPVAAKYGAMFILLPVGGGKIPETASERVLVAEKILSEAGKHGFSKDDMIVDGLVMTISSNQSAAQTTLDFIEWATNKGMNTVLGLSNVSFGLPERKWINTAFLAMASAKGLSAVIANPDNSELMSVKLACDALSSKDLSCARYISKFSENQGSQIKAAPKELSPEEAVHDAVLKGDREHIVEYVHNALRNGTAADKIVNELLIPAINKVGELFDRKEYYLPQLILSAEAMKKAFEILEPELAKNLVPGTPAKSKIILATVKGDIHDIGKNIVSLMMKNYGFEVIDLGKDVDHEKIVQTAQRSGAEIVGLSALMTTTMSNMRTIISDCRKAGLIKTKFIVGGAVLDQSFADEIGADGYAPDAVEAVRLAKRLIG